MPEVNEPRVTSHCRDARGVRGDGKIGGVAFYAKTNIRLSYGVYYDRYACIRYCRFSGGVESKTADGSRTESIGITVREPTIPTVGRINPARITALAVGTELAAATVLKMPSNVGALFLNLLMTLTAYQREKEQKRILLMP